ncbi:3-oxoadipate enol-lactonase [Ketogulonicigenium vulgare]|nr:3-oxoadipate enol-lactonase [Ketogulonicigenium vulgare]ALJ82869.1 3-oxoadipate enol-lactonase [Ketogulonicigenium vulgare]
MQVLARPWGAMHYRIDGPADGPVVVFANSLGTDLRLWDGVVARLPGFRCVRFDLPGHGLSDLAAEVSISALAEDVAALIATVASAPVVLVGLSIGGMIAQELAVKRPAMLAGIVLSNTATKMGSADAWAARIAAVEAGGLASIADQVMERWFAPAFRARATLPLWRNMLLSTRADGYIVACRALAAADLTGQAAEIDLPAVVIAGEKDGASPPDLVAASAARIAGARLHNMAGVGHLPPAEDAAGMVAIIAPFLKDVLK